MAKTSGVVGFAITEEKTVNGQGTGVWVDQIVERAYRGELVRNTHKLSASGEVNGILVLNKDVSIVADIYALQNYQNIVYFKFAGDERAWRVENVEPDRPRIKLTIGGIWNGQQTQTS